MSTETEQTKIDVKELRKNATKFVAKEFETEDYPLIKKTEIENQTFMVFKISKVQDEEGKSYFNFKALNDKDEPFCFNGSNILAEQVETHLPCYVKLVKVYRDDPLRPYYWVFANPE